MPKHITVVLPNKPGAFCEVAEVLAERNVNVFAYHAAAAGRTGFVQLLCHPHQEAVRVLKEKYKYYAVESDVIAVRVPNTPGMLLGVLKVLAEADINVLHSYLITDGPEATMLLDVESPEQHVAADKLLKAKGFHLVNEVVPDGSAI